MVSNISVKDRSELHHVRMLVLVAKMSEGYFRLATIYNGLRRMVRQVWMHGEDRHNAKSAVKQNIGGK
jgi:hypothetical protein